jgi:DNA-binding XRE family transcriptional regulator
MDTKEFIEIRHLLGRTQEKLAQLLCVSPKTVQSLEQGWRNIPPYVERELMLLLSVKTSGDKSTKCCWEIINCPSDWRDNCIVWELQAGHLCWYLNGTFCQGKNQESWRDKIQLCRECDVLRESIMPMKTTSKS